MNGHFAAKDSMCLGEHVDTLTFLEAGMCHGISSAEEFVFLPLPLFVGPGLMDTTPICWVVSVL